MSYIARELFPGATIGTWTGEEVRSRVPGWGGDLPFLDDMFYSAYGETLLGVAARQGKADVVEALLDLGADVNKGNEELGLTPLMWAAIQVGWR